MSSISKWVCPVCGITENVDTAHVPEKDVEGVPYYCSHCGIHTDEKVEMEAKQ